ncbi:MAG: hypothetical protein U5K84_03245 [Alkalibacterium sp.]|nr:hypothetical protein [Alkalibacterium sp.]
MEFLNSQDVIFEDSGLTSRVFGWNDDQDNVNAFRIMEGRLPESTNEIALDQTNRYADEYSIGDTVQVSEETSADQNEVFTDHTFEVVGFVKSPLYIERSERGSTTVGSGNLNGFSVVLSEVYDRDIYTDAYILFDQSAEYQAYSFDYQTFVEDRQAEVEELLSQRPAERYEELYTEIDEEISEGYEEIEEARQELEDGRADLEEARSEIDEGLADYRAGLNDLESEEADARAEIESERAQLNQALNEIDETIAELQAAQQQESPAYEELQTQRAQILAGLQEVTNAESQLDIEIASAREDLENARSDLEEAEEEYEEGLAEFEQEEADAEEDIAEALADLEEAESDLADLEEPENISSMTALLLQAMKNLKKMPNGSVQSPGSSLSFSFFWQPLSL